VLFWPVPCKVIAYYGFGSLALPEPCISPSGDHRRRELFEPLGEESVMSDTFTKDCLKLHGKEKRSPIISAVLSSVACGLVLAPA
jgi:hypothetical protein